MQSTAPSTRLSAPTATTSPYPYVGLVCRVIRVKPKQQHLTVWMHRCIAIEHTLTQYGLKLICYTPADICPNRIHVRGYVWEQGEFKPKRVPLPAVNYDWHVGPLDIKNRTGLHYAEFQSWAAQQQYHVFPSQLLFELTRDKWASYQELCKVAPRHVAQTELYTGQLAQLEAYVSQYPSVFIKPRHGSMGHQIIVIKSNRNGYTVTQYNKKPLTVQVSDWAAIQHHLNIQNINSDFIIQQGIDVARYQHAVFDIRLIMLNDGHCWHSIAEARIAAQGCDLSNIHQGGINLPAETVLQTCFSQHHANTILKSMRRIAHQVTLHLAKTLQQPLCEYAIDFLVDTTGHISIAEINAKPGLAGVPNLIADFANMTTAEKAIYENTTLLHGRYLATMLQKQWQRLPQPEFQDFFWFDDITTAFLAPNDVIDGLMRAIMQSITTQSYTLSDLPALFTQDEGKRIVYISIGTTSKPAEIYQGMGKGIKAAINMALAQCRRRSSLVIEHPEAITCCRLHIVQAVKKMPKQRLDEPLPYTRSSYGLAFSRTTGVSLLPEQLMAHTYMDSHNHIKLKRIIKNHTLPYTFLKKINTFNTIDIYRFRCDSYSVNNDFTVWPCYRGHRIYADVNPTQCLMAAWHAGQYLLKQIQPSGQFNYEYSPKKHDFSDKYNILRHAGCVYALAELIALTDASALREANNKALDYLLTQTIPWPIANPTHPKMLCISEQGMIKLGANALGILAITQQAAVSESTNHLATAAALAEWIVHTQDKSGEFLLHKCLAKTGEKTDFISGYYPGEAVFALARLYACDHNPRWLAASQRAADFLINQCNNTPVEKLAHDHWLLYGLNELHKQCGAKHYLVHTVKLCNAIMAKQHQHHPSIDYNGGFYTPPRSTPTAVRAEGLYAAYQCLERAGLHAKAQQVLTALQQCIRFQLQTQWTLDTALYCPKPSACVGGFSKSLTDFSIRIDYVQHNLSALLGLFRIGAQILPIK